MCGAQARDMTWRQIYDLYNIHTEGPPPNEPSANLYVKPTDPIPICIQGEDGPEIVMARWWFHGDWARRFDANRDYPTFNSVSEKVYDRKTYKAPFERGQRALVPVTGIYEKPVIDGEAQWLLIDMEECHSWSMAALYNKHKAIPDKKGNDVHYTVTLFTTRPNIAYKEYHHRMVRPVPQHDYYYWLDPTLHHQEAHKYLGSFDAAEAGLTWEFSAIEKPGVQGGQFD